MVSDVLTGVNVKVQPKSGFDKSRKNIFTTKVGTITPILSDICIPNTDVYVKMAISAALPPLASETFMRASFKVEAFAVPMRLLYGGFESWLTGAELYDDSGNTFRAQLPRIKLVSSNTGFFGKGSLLDYLGAQIETSTFSGGQDYQNTEIYLNAFLPLAYARIYDDWYRNTKIQKPLFSRPGDMSIVPARLLRCLPFVSFSTIKDLIPFHSTPKFHAQQEDSAPVDSTHQHLQSP